MDIHELRLRGNNLYAANEYNSAIDIYTQALEVSPGNAIILGNRSACYLAVGQPYKAECDARLALSIEPTFLKCYFRLATALKARNAVGEAIEVIDLGLRQDSTSVALRNFKQVCLKEFQQSLSETENDGIAMKKGFLDVSNRRVRMKDENGSIAAKVVINKDSETAIDPVEMRMTTELKSLIKRILTGNFGSEDMSKHMLHGMFKQLMDKETFADILFPGASESVQRDLPMNLKDLLSWDILSLDLSKIAGKAASIFNGIKSKGEKRGDFMDSTTEAILMPQIVEEAMAREVVETVRNLSKRVSGLNAKVSLALATPTEEEGSWDQIGSEVSDALSSSEHALGVQHKFLGTEWSTLVLEDVIRFAADEKMTGMSNETSILNCPLGYPNDNHSRDSKSHDANISRMAWIEEDTVSESYPALGELLQQLHALPYEINAKSNCALRLLQPARGCTMMVHYAHGSVQPLRTDNKENEFDSGIRVTCAYHLVPREGLDGASETKLEDMRPVGGQKSKGPIAQLLHSIIDSGKDAKDKDKDKDKDKGQQEGPLAKPLPRNFKHEDMHALAVEHDQLVLHQSVKVLNTRTVAKGEYFVIYYFIHGK